MQGLYEQLEKDVRYKEGMKACMNCGVCPQFVLLLGHDTWNIGLQSHQLSVEPLLDKIGISYNPELKYKGLDGEDIGAPEHPEVLKCC